jgi:hypothetical protein
MHKPTFKSSVGERNIGRRTVSVCPAVASRGMEGCSVSRVRKLPSFTARRVIREAETA